MACNVAIAALTSVARVDHVTASAAMTAVSGERLLFVTEQGDADKCRETEETEQQRAVHGSAPRIKFCAATPPRD